MYVLWFVAHSFRVFFFHQNIVTDIGANKQHYTKSEAQQSAAIFSTCKSAAQNAQFNLLKRSASSAMNFLI